MEKITKKNSILYNQLWINKALEEGNYKLLPSKKNKHLSIGEYLEIKYINKKEEPSPKITKKNSLLFLREWLEKYKEESLRVPKRVGDRSLAETLETNYFVIEVMRKAKEQRSEKVLELGYKWW